jgi:hypothetical protein
MGSSQYVDAPKPELAELMFKAYNAAGPNPNKSWDGKDVPPWEACGDQVQTKWRAAAKAAQEELTPKPATLEG